MYNNYYQQQPINTMSQRVAPPQMIPQQQFGSLRGHPVSSLEEVKATSIEFDGSIFYFPDIANKRIYTKTVDNSGIAQLNMYELKPIPTENINGDFVTRQEFDSAMAKIAELLSQKQANVPLTPNTQENPQQKNFKEVF